MAKIVQLPDGTEVSFPDDTSMDVIDSTVKRDFAHLFEQPEQEQATNGRIPEWVSPLTVLPSASTTLAGMAGIADIATQVGGIVRSKLGKGLTAGVGLLTGQPLAARAVESVRVPVGRTISDVGTEASQVLQEGAQEAMGGFAGKAAQTVSRVAAQSSPSFIAARFLGFPGAVATAGLQSFGSNFEDWSRQLEQQGMSQEEAADAAYWPAMVGGVATSALTAVFGGTERFLSQIGSGAIKRDAAKGILRSILTKRFGQSIVTEGFEEGLDEFTQAVIEMKKVNPDLTWTDALKRGGLGWLLGTAISTGVSGLGLATAQRQPPPPAPPPIPGPVPPWEPSTDLRLPDPDTQTRDRIIELSEQRSRVEEDIRRIPASQQPNRIHILFQERQGISDEINRLRDTIAFRPSGWGLEREQLIGIRINQLNYQRDRINQELESSGTRIRPGRGVALLDELDRIFEEIHDLQGMLPGIESATQESVEEFRERTKFLGLVEPLGGEPVKRMTEEYVPPPRREPKALLPGAAIQLPEQMPAPPAPPPPPTPKGLLTGAAIQLPESSAVPPEIQQRIEEVVPEGEFGRPQEPETPQQEALRRVGELAPPAGEVFRAERGGLPATAEELRRQQQQQSELSQRIQRLRQQFRQGGEATTVAQPTPSSTPPGEASVNPAPALPPPLPQQQAQAGITPDQIVAARVRMRQIDSELDELRKPRPEITDITQVEDLIARREQLEDERARLERQANSPPSAFGAPPATWGFTMNAIRDGLATDPGTAPATVPPPADATDIGKILTPFQPWESAKKIFARAFGFQRLKGARYLWGPAAKMQTPVGVAQLTYSAEAEGVARAKGSLIGERIRGLIDTAFTVNEQGDVTNVPDAPAEVGTKKSDLLAHIRANRSQYNLTPEQNRAMDMADEIISTMARMGFTRGDVEGTEDPAPIDKKYWPRHVVERPKPKGGRPGSGRFIIKPTHGFGREFETEFEGWEKGYKYDTSPERDLVKMVEEGYRAEAGKRLAAAPELGGQERADIKDQFTALVRPDITEEVIRRYGIERHNSLEQQLFYLEQNRETDSDQYKALSKERDKVQSRINEAVEDRFNRHIRGQTVRLPGFAGRIFPPEVADQLNRLAESPSRLRRNINSVNAAIKFMALGYDLGVPFIQGLPLMASNPKVWGKSYYNMVRALVKDPDLLAKQIQNNPAKLAAAAEAAEYGMTYGSLVEFLVGGSGSGLLAKAGKKLGKPGEAFASLTDRFGKSFTTFIDSAKLDLYMANRDRYAAAGRLPDLVREVESSLQLGRMESSGVSPNRALLERILFLAPAYYRGAVDLIGSAALHPTVGGKMSLSARSLAGYLAAGAGLFAAFGTAMVKMGLMDEDEFEKRFNPASSNFMMLDMPVPFSNRRMKIGVGGVIRSLVRVMGKVVANPEGLTKFGSRDNPLIWWLRGHTSPVPGMVWDMGAGTDFLGEEAGVGSWASRPIPLWLRDAWEFPEKLSWQPEPLAKALAARFSASAPGFFGLNAYPESVWSQMGKDLEATSRAEFSKSYPDLNLRELRRVNEIVKAKPDYSGQKQSVRDVVAREQARQRREERVAKKISPEITQFMEDRGLDIGSYSTTMSIGGQNVSLTQGQRERLEELTIQNLNEMIGRRLESLSRLDDEKLKKQFDDLKSKARSRARSKLKSEINRRK